MRRTERVALGMLALVLIASMLLSACVPAAAPAPAQAPAPAAATQAPEAPKAAAPSDKPVTLTLWGGFPEMEPFYKYVGEAYTKEHPNVKVEVLTHSCRPPSLRTPLPTSSKSRCMRTRSSSRLG